MSGFNLVKLPLAIDLETKNVLKALPTAHAALAELKGVASNIPNQIIHIHSYRQWSIRVKIMFRGHLMPGIQPHFDNLRLQAIFTKHQIQNLLHLLVLFHNPESC